KHIRAACTGMPVHFATSDAGRRGLVREDVAHTLRDNYSAQISRVLLTFVHSAAEFQDVRLERELDGDRPAAFDAETDDVLAPRIPPENFLGGLLSLRPVVLVHSRQ